MRATAAGPAAARLLWGRVGSILLAPPQTSQRYWPVPLHALHFPTAIPAINRLPLPPQGLQVVVL